MCVKAKKDISRILIIYVHIIRIYVIIKRKKGEKCTIKYKKKKRRSSILSRDYISLEIFIVAFDIKRNVQFKSWIFHI